jgi:hypothetical protein
MTALNLPPGRSESEAIRIARQHREIIWRTISGPEDRRIDAFVDVCSAMCQGDRASGKRLAQIAIWSPTP